MLVYTSNCCHNGNKGLEEFGFFHFPFPHKLFISVLSMKVRTLNICPKTVALLFILIEQLVFLVLLQNLNMYAIFFSFDKASYYSLLTHTRLYSSSYSLQFKICSFHRDLTGGENVLVCLFKRPEDQIYK